MHALSSRGIKATPNLVPLLDVVMQLIMFFMLTVNFVRTDQLNESIVLPVAQSGVPLDKTVKDVLFLNMNKDGKLLVPGENLDTDSKIGAYLRNQRQRAQTLLAKEKGEDPGDKMLVVLRAHRLAKSKDVFRVFRLCTEAGYKRYQSRVQSENKAS
jgi:biopolymer transport protein ExbD